jgi:hypothetical protein
MNHILMWSNKNVVRSTFKRLLKAERKIDSDIFMWKKVLMSPVCSYTIDLVPDTNNCTYV